MRSIFPRLAGSGEQRDKIDKAYPPIAPALPILKFVDLGGLSDACRTAGLHIADS